MSNYIPQQDIEQICTQLQIDFEKITNVYLYGSHIRNSYKEDSDYDILIVGDFEEPSLNFTWKKHPYFYRFKMNYLDINNRKYDAIYHSNKNFEKLLSLNFLMFIEPLFADEKFIPINKINYKKIFLEKYCTPYKLYFALKQEKTYGIIAYRRYIKKKDKFDSLWLLRKVYHVLRYHEMVLYFIKTGTFRHSMTNLKMKVMEIAVQNNHKSTVDMYDELLTQTRIVLALIKSHVLKKIDN